MDHRNIFSNPRVTQEFLDRFPALAREYAPTRTGVLESLEAPRMGLDHAARAVRAIQQGSTTRIDPALEAIILKFGRPAYFVLDDTYDTKDAPSSSAEVNAVVNGARPAIEAAIPSVGRINLRNNRATWVGTGWVVAPNVVVTNRHVALLFAERQGDAFVFIETEDGRRSKASLDTCREFRRPRENVFRLTEVLWIEPQAQDCPDIAFLSMSATSDDGTPPPRVIELLAERDYNALPVQSWVAVIGYPAYSSYNDAQDQQRIFDGVFNVKRLQPGLIVAKQANGVITHDATTLGGNSGSAVIDLASGRAVALHFGGLEGETNQAVAAPVVAKLLEARAL